MYRQPTKVENVNRQPTCGPPTVAVLVGKEETFLFVFLTRLQRIKLHEFLWCKVSQDLFQFNDYSG